MEKKLLTMKLSDIIPYENNPRKNAKAVDVVAESIEQTGYNNPIVVDEDNIILAGHTRLMSLKKLNKKEVEVLKVSGLTDEQKRKYRLLDNKVGEYATWDYVALMDELDGLDWNGLELDWGIQSEENFPDMDEFESFDEELETKYKCPECGYEW